MRIVIITQDDPFYLAENIEYLLGNMPTHSSVVGCVVFAVSPFGKKEGFIGKAKRTLDIFGLHFFLHYSLKFTAAKFNSAKNIRHVLKKRGIPELYFESSINAEESLDAIRNLNPDLLVSIAGNQIFKQPLIELAPQGCLNLHTALLPKYRGLMPSFWVLKNNEQFTGVSVFFVDEGIDSGPILVQKKVAIDGMTQEQLISKTKRKGMDAIL